MRSTSIRNLLLLPLTLVVGLLFVQCSEETNLLGTAPTGFSFTDEDGNVITEIEAGDTVQLRDEDGNVVFAFTTNADADISDAVAGRTDAVSFAHLTTTTGLTGDITLFLPCGPTTNTIEVCPGADEAGEVADDCADGVTLSINSPTNGAYTFANASTRNGNIDCQVSADVSEFSTGGLGSFVEGNGTPPEEDDDDNENSSSINAADFDGTWDVSFEGGGGNADGTVTIDADGTSTFDFIGAAIIGNTVNNAVNITTSTDLEAAISTDAGDVTITSFNDSTGAFTGTLDSSTTFEGTVDPTDGITGGTWETTEFGGVNGTISTTKQ